MPRKRRDMPTSLDEYRRLRDTRVGVDRTRTLSFYRTLSSTVSIVSAMSEELGPLGLTVSAVSAVSAEPPLLSVCLAHESQTLRAAAESGRFAVHVLQAHQRGLATEFATSNTPRFRAHGFAHTYGAPVLTEAETWTVCEVVDTCGYGDRTLLIGHVIHTHEGTKGAPLVWHDSSFLPVTELQERD